MEGLILTKPSHGGARTNAGSVAREDFGFQSVWATLLLSAALLLATHQAHGAATPGHGDSLGRVSELDVAVQVSGGSGAFLLRPGGFGYLSRSQAMGQAGRDVIDTMITTPGLETFMTALQIAGLTGLLREAADVHLFAPTDEAFARLGSGVRDALLADRIALMEMLSHHIVFNADPRAPNTVAGAAQARTGRLPTGGVPRVLVVDGDATNGVVYVVDAVILTN
jgi:hypothetical protein